jgi:hypothetical protein
MKTLILALALTTAFSTGAFAQDQTNPASEASALAAVTSLMRINFGSQDQVVTKVLNASAQGDDNDITETFTIKAYATKDGRRFSTDFFYTIQVLDGSVWSVSTRCPTCS